MLPKSMLSAYRQFASVYVDIEALLLLGRTHSLSSGDRRTKSSPAYHQSKSSNVDIPVGLHQCGHYHPIIPPQTCFGQHPGDEAENDSSGGEDDKYHADSDDFGSLGGIDIESRTIWGEQRQQTGGVGHDDCGREGMVTEERR